MKPHLDLVDRLMDGFRLRVFAQELVVTNHMNTVSLFHRQLLIGGTICLLITMRRMGFSPSMALQIRTNKSLEVQVYAPVLDSALYRGIK